MTGCVVLSASLSTDFNRNSNSPRILAPAIRAPTSRLSNRTDSNGGGTSPETIAQANPSTTAVLPTPASPVNNGLFCRRRSKISIIVRISYPRPTTGSIFPSRANAVRSVQYLLNADCCLSSFSKSTLLDSPGIADVNSEPS